MAKNKTKEEPGATSEPETVTVAEQTVEETPGEATGDPAADPNAETKPARTRMVWGDERMTALILAVANSDKTAAEVAQELSQRPEFEGVVVSAEQATMALSGLRTRLKAKLEAAHGEGTPVPLGTFKRQPRTASGPRGVNLDNLLQVALAVRPAGAEAGGEGVEQGEGAAA